MKRFIIIFFSTFLVYFFLWFVLYKTNINTLPIQSEDTLPTIFTTVSIIKDKTLYLDNYYDMLIKKYPHPDDKSYEKDLVPFYLRKVNDHYLTAFPITVSLLSLPIFYLPLKLGMGVTWENLIILSHIASALIMSLSVGFFYLLLRKRLIVDEKNSSLLTIVYAFGTINFALFSQAMWQYAALQLFLILGLYFVVSRQTFLSGFFSGFALLTRPTALLPIMFYPLKNIRLKRLLVFGLGFLPAILLFFWYNNTYFTDISNQGYADQLFVGWQSPFPEGFLGIWLSPSKGILIYSPIFIFSLVGLYLAIKEKRINYIIFGFIVFAHTLVMGFWKHWYGGYSFGYRMAGDIIPFLVLLLVPFLESKLFKKYKKLFFIALLFSIIVQIFGMIFFDGIWHAAYDLGYSNTSWLWSVKDSEFMFNMRRILVKFNLLDKACPVCL